MAGGKSKGGGSAPPVPELPDAPELGADSSQLMMQQALSTILNASGPFGSSTVTGSPETGYTRQTDLAPELQSMYSQILDPGAGKDYTQAYFDRAMNLMRPEQERAMQAEEVGFAQRGLPVGSELRSDIEASSGRQRNEAMERLAMSSIMQGEGQKGRDLQQFMQLASGVPQAQGPQVDTLSSFQMPFQAATLPYLQQIQRQNMQYGADVSQQQQDAANKSASKQGLLGAGGNVAGAMLTPPPVNLALQATA